MWLVQAVSGLGAMAVLAYLLGFGRAARRLSRARRVLLMAACLAYPGAVVAAQMDRAQRVAGHLAKAVFERFLVAADQPGEGPGRPP